MNSQLQNSKIWQLLVPASGAVALAFLAVVGLSLVAGAVGLVSWIAIRLLPVLAAGAILYWLGRETGLWAKWFGHSER